jgi:uncharacterized membrane protein YeaQ/YmgE (transglycosylase-associated protein family)
MGYRTPSIDQIAAEGMRFTDSYGEQSCIAGMSRGTRDSEGSVNIGSFIAACALGFVAGAIARALIPNDAFRNMRGIRSWLTSLVLGLLGALAGYWIFHGIFGIGDTDKFDWGGIIGAIIGAMIVVAVASFLIKRFAKGRVAG